MKRFAMIAATGIMALMISACGDNAAPKPEAQADDMQSQTQEQMAAPAAPASSQEGMNMAPAEPSSEAMEDAAAQE
ncbi:MAG: hypothetical protein P1U39_04005 [Legionellaceae bacterium]|nr:hypothetical protein [Legionellaceae bacterium]